MPGVYLARFQMLLDVGESMPVKPFPCTVCGYPIYRRVGKSQFEGIVVAFLENASDEPDIAEFYFPLVGAVYL